MRQLTILFFTLSFSTQAFAKIDKLALKYVLVGGGYNQVLYSDKSLNKLIGSGFLIEKRGDSFKSSNQNTLEYVQTWGFENYKTVLDGSEVITPKMAIFLTYKASEEAERGLRRVLKNFNSLSKARQVVMLDMMVSLGEPNFKKFKKMIAYIEDENWEMAGEEIKNSQWFKEVKSRGERDLNAFITNNPLSLKYAIDKELDKELESLDFEDLDRLTVEKIYKEELLQTAFKVATDAVQIIRKRAGYERLTEARFVEVSKVSFDTPKEQRTEKQSALCEAAAVTRRAQYLQERADNSSLFRRADAIDSGGSGEMAAKALATFIDQAWCGNFTDGEVEKELAEKAQTPGNNDNGGNPGGNPDGHSGGSGSVTGSSSSGQNLSSGSLGGDNGGTNGGSQIGNGQVPKEYETNNGNNIGTDPIKGGTTPY